MTNARLALEWIPGRFAVCRLDPGAAIPAWAVEGGPLVSITRTEDELSIVAPEEAVPSEVQAERGWDAIRVVGKLDFSMVGVLAGLTGALAEAGVSVFAVSTFDTDILLVREGDSEAAVVALGAVADVSRLNRGGRGLPNDG